MIKLMKFKILVIKLDELNGVAIIVLVIYVKLQLVITIANCILGLSINDSA